MTTYHFVKFLTFWRCFFKGHEFAEVPIVLTKCEFSTQPAVVINFKSFKISSPLTYCRSCGLVRFGEY